MAELVARYPKRFPAFIAALPMNNPAAAEKELDRACGELGALGVQMYSNVAGKPLDLPEFQPLFDELARRDRAMWMHPMRDGDFSDYATENRSKYEIWWTFGWPYETSVAMARMVFSGLFDRYPGPEDHHAPHGRDDSVLRGPGRATAGTSWASALPTKTTSLCGAP